MVKLSHLKKFWKGKKVFITGHTGFKGSWLIIILNLLGAKVYGYSLKPKKISLFNQIDGSRIVIKNNGSDRYMSNWNGVAYVSQQTSTIMYSSSHMVDVLDGDKFYLHTSLLRNISPVSSEAMSCVIHIIEI